MKNRILIISSTVLAVLIIGILSYLPTSVHGQSVGVVLTGQQAVTATAAVVSGISYGTVCIKALSTNTASVFIGGPGVTDAKGFELTATEVPYCATVNALPFYVIAAATGSSISWIETR